MLSVWVADSSHTKPAFPLAHISSSFASCAAEPWASQCRLCRLGKCQSVPEQDPELGGSGAESMSVVPNAFPVHLLLRDPKQLPPHSPDPLWGYPSGSTFATASWSKLCFKTGIFCCLCHLLLIMASV